eukprot:705746-Prymnesium_polylepis.2
MKEAPRRARATRAARASSHGEGDAPARDSPQAAVERVLSDVRAEQPRSGSNGSVAGARSTTKRIAFPPAVFPPAQS